VKPKFVIALSIIIVGLILFLGFYFTSDKEEKVISDTENLAIGEILEENKFLNAKIGETDIILEIVRTPEERRRGLSGRDSLAQDQGMLFIFEKPVRASFWMKEMSFPLDFIWLRNNVVVGLTENVQPPELGTADSDLEIYQSEQLVDMALEVNAGWIAKNLIKSGMRLQVLQ